MFTSLLITHPKKPVSPLERSIGFNPTVENQIFRNEMSEKTMTGDLNSFITSKKEMYQKQLVS
jgi:hypothetical protein